MPLEGVNVSFGQYGKQQIFRATSAMTRVRIGLTRS